uniref:Uncharacterized protein n=1 Tax=Megaselia scalaris TaxID=36166 RepID=T1GUH0_MEGSC
MRITHQKFIGSTGWLNTGNTDYGYKYCEHLNKFGKSHYPCIQICSVEECLKMAWTILWLKYFKLENRNVSIKQLLLMWNIGNAIKKFSLTKKMLNTVLNVVIVKSGYMSCAKAFK